MSSVLRQDFYSRNPQRVARELIGKVLVRRLSDGKLLKGVIVETEAYGGDKDPASHAHAGMTSRNSVMFGEAGRAYVYFTYGFHYCLNFVTGRKGKASAVLLRALEPKEGIDRMIWLRNKFQISELTNGPGKICQALLIDLSLNGIDVTSTNSKIHVLDECFFPKVVSGTRIGIKKAVSKRWRFFAKASGFVSRA